MPPAEGGPDPYVLPFSGGVLRNRLGISNPVRLEREEADLASARYYELLADPPRPPFTFATLRAVHARLFGDVYDWAGRPRTTHLRKADDPHRPFAPPHLIEARADAAFRALAERGNLEGLGRGDFVAGAARLLADLNSVHPFRDGNGRAQRLLLQAVAENAGHPLTFRAVTRERMTVASMEAHRGDVSGLARLLDEAADPRRVAAVAKVIGAMRAAGRADWNDRYVAATVAGQPYEGTLGGRAGADFFMLARHPRRGDWVAVGDARDLPPGAATGARVALVAAHFVPSAPSAAPTPTVARPAGAPDPAADGAQNRPRRGGGPSPGS